MAEANYRRLECRSCGAEFFKAGRGRNPHCCGDCRERKTRAPRPSVPARGAPCRVNDCGSPAFSSGYCAKHYRQLRKYGEVGPRRQTCEQCGADYLSERKKKYCSAECNKTAQNRKAGWGPRSEYLARVRNEKHWFSCEWCGKESHRVLSGRARECGYSNRWCSMECKAKHLASERAKAEGTRLVARERKRLISAIKRRLASIQREAASEARRLFELSTSPPAKTCRHCGAVFAPRMRQKDCDACADIARREYNRRRRKSASGRAEKKKYKTIRRARKAIKAESIDPIKAFERDGWRCHLCGCRTPRRLRGTNEPRAPELDHIVSLADGGSHTWGNVACACRACNGAKGAESRGQLGLGLGMAA